jgi:hypothetical protein
VKRTIGFGVIGLVLLGAAAAATVLSNDPTAPWPSEDELRTAGFAVWPQDTVEEAERSCEQADAWQLDPEQTALRFVQEVFAYPEEELRASAITEPVSENEKQFLVTADGEDLGSSVFVTKYGACWFVVRAEPREGAFFPSIGYSRNATRLIVYTGGVPAHVGYGRTDVDIPSDQDQSVIDISEEPPTTGHVVSAGTAYPFGNSIVAIATDPFREMTDEQVTATKGVCDHEESFRNAHLALEDLLTFDLSRRVVSASSRDLVLAGGDTVRKRRDDRWAIKLGAVQLTAHAQAIKPGCWRVIAIDDDRPSSALTSLRAIRDTAAFRVRWGKATSADVTLSSARGSQQWTFGRFKRPISVWTFEDKSLGPKGPFEVTVVLRDGKRIVEAERAWYAPRT